MRLYGIATDDDEGYYYSCHAWVRVKAVKNNTRDILSALKNGEFYSSCGPEIYDFYVDGNKVVVECSDVDRIRLHCAKHPTAVVRSADGSVSQAEFCIDDSYPYVRATVIDKNGKHAWTNPIFLSDSQGDK